MMIPRKLIASFYASQAAGRRGARRRPREARLSCESLEGRVTPAHISIAHHAVAHVLHAAQHAQTDSSTGTTTSSTAIAATSTTSSSSGSSRSSDGWSSSGWSSSSSSAVSAALKQLYSDILTIEESSGVTVAQLADIASAFQTLKNDGLSPSSESALKSFENSLVTDFASGTTLVGNSTLLSEFEALYTSSPTAQETTDLTTAYDALAAAVTSSNITSADITTINNDWSALLAAEGSTSTNTFPYFDLVTGQAINGHHGFGGDYGSSSGGWSSSNWSSSSSSAVSAALKQLHSDILTIEESSGVTVAQLADIASSFQTLRNDGLSPSSKSALKSFENSLVTDFASGTTLVGNSTLLSQFEALYTSSPTAQETTDLTTAYNALAAAVTSSNITSADITTINNDWSALLAAEGSTSTSTFPYFELVTGQAINGHYGFGGDYGGGGGGC